MEERWINVIALENPENIKGPGRRTLSRRLPSADLAGKLSEFVCGFSEALENISDTISGYDLDEIEVSVEVSAEGEISLVGAVSVGSSGGITLKFKKKTGN